MKTGTVLAFINQKGGTTKTTTAAAVGAGLAKQSKRVLFVDTDAQSNLTQHLQADDADGATVYDVLTGSAGAADAIRHTAQGDIIPAAFALASYKGNNPAALREALQPLRRLYDFIIIDAPPALGSLTGNILLAADFAIIPAQADAFSLQGIYQLATTAEVLRRSGTHAAQILGIVLTRYNPRSILARSFTEQIEDAAASIGTHVFKTRIREGVAVREAQAVGESLFDYAPRAKVTADYAELVAEIIEQIRKAQNGGRK